jgi:DNA-binding transcriptional MerR regulator
MFIAEAAERAGVNPQTLRYYERRGLLRPAARRSSGYREYSADDVRRVRFVKRAQELGFSLDDIAALLALRSPQPARRERVRAVAEARLTDIDARIRDLQQMRRALGRLVRACHDHTTMECPIVEALEPAGGDRHDH